MRYYPAKSSSLERLYDVLAILGPCQNFFSPILQLFVFTWGFASCCFIVQTVVATSFKSEDDEEVPNSHSCRVHMSLCFGNFDINFAN